MKCFLIMFTVRNENKKGLIVKSSFSFSHVHNNSFCVGTMLVFLPEQNIENYHFAEVQKQNVRKFQKKVLFIDI